MSSSGNPPVHVAKFLDLSHFRALHFFTTSLPLWLGVLLAPELRNIVIYREREATEDRGGASVPRLMAVEAWYMDDNNDDQRLPHHKNPKKYVPLTKLAELGVMYWQLNPKDYENDEELKQIREERGYNYMDILDLCRERVENYEEKLKNFYREHIHADEEIRYCLEGSGYFDVRDDEDHWIRVWVKEGDMIILPAGIYHRFTLDTSNYVKLMRLFKGEPVWTAHNRPQENHPARKEYMSSFLGKPGVALKAH